MFALVACALLFRGAPHWRRGIYAWVLGRRGYPADLPCGRNPRRAARPQRSDTRLAILAELTTHPSPLPGKRVSRWRPRPSRFSAARNGARLTGRFSLRGRSCSAVRLRLAPLGATCNSVRSMWPQTPRRMRMASRAAANDVEDRNFWTRCATRSARCEANSLPYSARSRQSRENAPPTAGRGRKKAAKAVRRRERPMSDEQRRAVAERMRKYWAARREAKAQEEEGQE